MKQGTTFAIFGLGRSGLSVAKACLKRQWIPTIYDESSENDLAKPELLTEAIELGICCILGESFQSVEADFIIANPAIDMRHWALQNAIQPVWSEIEFAYKISKAPIVAITGTNGKSTTALMTYQALKALGVDAVLCGNIYGSGHKEVTLTEAADESNRDHILVAEISSFQLEWVHDFAPLAAVITVITPDHLNRYDSMKQYAQTKMKIWNNAKVVIANWDDPLQKPSGTEIKTFGFMGKDAVLSPGKIKIFNQEFKAEEFAVIGEHNLANLACAALLADIAHPGHSLEIVESLKQFKGLDHRMEFVANTGGITFINNSMCTNPAAIEASVKGLRQRTHILIGGVNKQLPFWPLKDYLETTRHQVYIYGKDSQQICEELGGKWSIYDTIDEAFDAALKAAKEDEIVMLAPGCASSDQFIDFRHRGEVFRKLVTDLTL
jgi:UDP-N-acetylmuramoylalanine--D-glutamate ligase